MIALARANDIVSGAALTLVVPLGLLVIALVWWSLVLLRDRRRRGH